MSMTRKTGLRILAAACALLVCGAAHAQTAEEIIAKNLKAIGGMDAIKKIKTLHRKGDISVTGQFGDMMGEAESKVVIGQKVWDSMDLGMFFRITGWTGGDTGWTDDAMQGLRDISGDELAMTKAQSEINPFIGYKERGLVAKRGEDMKVAKVSMDMMAAAPAAGGGDGAAAEPPADMVDCYVVELGPEGGESVKILVDKATNLIFQILTTRTDDNFGEMTLVIENSEYEEHNGVKLVKNMKMAMGDMMRMETIFGFYELNGAIDDAVFAKPTPPPAPPSAPAAAPAAPAN